MASNLSNLRPQIALVERQRQRRRYYDLAFSFSHVVNSPNSCGRLGHEIHKCAHPMGRVPRVFPACRTLSTPVFCCARSAGGEVLNLDSGSQLFGKLCSGDFVLRRAGKLKLKWVGGEDETFCSVSPTTHLFGAIVFGCVFWQELGTSYRIHLQSALLLCGLTVSRDEMAAFRPKL